MTTIRSVDRLTAAEAADVLALAAAAGQADGVYPLSEDIVLRVRGGSDAHLPADVHLPAGTHLLARARDGGLAGYACLDADRAGELVVHPAHRRQGHGTALLAAAGPQPLRFWAHGDEPAARAFAGRHGFSRARVLWQMRRPLTTGLPDIPLPAGVTLRHFKAGHDEQAWLDVNARAFADHPEQGRWTLDDLLLREAEPWFDPAGFLLAVDVADTLLGFHWTKAHSAEIGEIYVLAVDPGGHRRGLGAALSVAGLRHLAGTGRTTAMLYVDESNVAAVRLYRGLGFEIYQADVNYRRD